MRSGPAGAPRIGSLKLRRGYRGNAASRLLFSYVRSKALGDLNTFTAYLGDFPTVRRFAEPLHEYAR